MVEHRRRRLAMCETGSVTVGPVLGRLTLQTALAPYSEHGI